MEAEDQQVENEALNGELGNERVYRGKWGVLVVHWVKPQEVSLKSSARGVIYPLEQLTPSHSFQSIK